MVSWTVSFIAICALASVGMTIPIIEEQHQIGIPETVVGHEEIVGHQVSLSPELETKHATSYQEFNLEGKHAVPVVIKTIHPPTIPVKHIPIAEPIKHEIGHEISQPISHIGQEIGHEISQPISHIGQEIGQEIGHEIEPIGLKLH